ncbi:hypothetical protein [Micromonospora carbonacea]|uniref:Uncharacterized protein n=1 Tax=Micromonospora carbonacea TaxID=47853 RepID=A0A1C4WEA8_9ACTN|nr:hypothetical protein [Micromonospora carbonacea]SCE94587.1 hypothetical protein GA0070563_103318 [Micromonospora carbonacea]
MNISIKQRAAAALAGLVLTGGLLAITSAAPAMAGPNTGSASSTATNPAGRASSTDAGTLATIPLSGSSTSGNSSISGYYTYNADGTAGGRAKYDGRFENVKLTDNIAGNGLGAALVLEYDEWVNGAWGHVYPYISRTGSDGTTSWSFNDKANIRVSVCDYNSSRDFINCRRLV